MNKPAYIFCEGGGKSHDFRILGNIVTHLVYPPELVPTGSKRGMPAFVIGYFEGAKVVTNKHYLAFRDRDFDFPVPDFPSLIQSPDRPRIFASYRTTIENYLIDPSTFLEYLRLNNMNATGIGDEETLKNLFEDVARELKYYSSVRHALGSMRENMDFQTTWTGKSGILPDSLEEGYCIGKSLELIEPSRLKSANLTSEVFETNYAYFLNKFSEEFFERGDYLIWFHGKDFMERIRQRLTEVNFSPNSFYNFAHQRFNFRKFPDLIELFEKLNNLS